MISFDRVATNVHESYNFHEPLSYPTGSSTLPSLVGRVLLHVGYHRLKLTPVLNTEMQDFIYLFIYLFMLNEQHF